MKFVLRPVVAALAACASLSAFATDGYFSHGYGMKAKGMGGAATAYTDSAFAGANNPALTSWAGNRTEFGLDWFSPNRSTDAAMAGGSTISSNSNNFYIPEFGYNRNYDAKWSYGVTVYGNGGMNTDYPTSPVGNPSGASLGVNLEQLIVAPTLSFRLDEKQSIGLSPLFVYQTISVKGINNFGPMSQKSSALTDNGNSSSTGVGLRLGYFGKLNEQFDVGVSYAPKIKMSQFDKYSGLFNSSFDIPENYNFGFAYKASSDLKVLMDYQRINYNKVKAIGNPTSVFGSCFNTVMQQQPATNNSNCLGGSNGPGFGWQSVNVIKLGIEWRQTPSLTLRAGYNHTTNPIKSEDVMFNIMAPGVMTKHYTLGGTYDLSKENELTLAYMYAPLNSVAGTNMMAAPASDTIRMKQQSIGIQYSIKY
jgi:long-chain fatty acid transport protein